MFSNTRIKINKRSSSIVIKFDENKGISEIQLPIGFDEFPSDNYELKKTLFFQTYHTYRKFIEEKKAQSRSNDSSKNKYQESDTVYEDKDRFQFKDNITGEIITYQKLRMFDSIIDSYDEFKIQALQDKISKSSNIDFSKLHRYLHQAIYLPPDHDIYIDDIDQPKKIIKDATTEIVEMFCFIYSEILKEFGFSKDNLKVNSLANNFRENRLFEDSALFSEDTYLDTIEILKEVLDEIDRTTPYKDLDYWHFYDAIYNFIYSNNDGFWSLDNFSFIWERMCLAYANKYFKENIALFDNFGSIESRNSNQSIKECFKVSLNNNDSNCRFIRPDLLLRDSPFNVDVDFIEKIYTIIKKEDSVDVTYNRDINIYNYFEIEKLKKEEFKNKPRIKAFLNSTGRYPPTFTLTYQEFESFKDKARSLLLKKSIFELAMRHPKVISSSINEIYNTFLVVDYKYINYDAFTEHPDSQIIKTIRKQLVYELALRLNRNSYTRSEFWIPGFLNTKHINSPTILRRYVKECDDFFQKFRISIIQLDFLSLQQLYIKNDI